MKEDEKRTESFDRQMEAEKMLKESSLPLDFNPMQSDCFADGRNHKGRARTIRLSNSTTPMACITSNSHAVMG